MFAGAILKRASFSAFSALERLGLHVLPAHYYTPVADRRWLREHPDLWQQELPLHLIDWDIDAQLAWLESLRDSGFAIADYDRIAAGRFGHGFGPVEAVILHRYVAMVQPRLVVEVGSGASTAVVSAAGAGRIIAIEPYPSEALASLGVEVVQEFAQAAQANIFGELAAGDLLLLDTTHAVKTGSELVRLYLDVIPSLPPGVTVHIHDMFLPYPYPCDVLTTYFDWQETLLVAALLTGNQSLRVLCCEAAIHYARPDALAAIVPGYVPKAGFDGLAVGHDGHFPSGLWLQTA